MNAETAYAIGETFERLSREGGQQYQGIEGDYRDLAHTAMGWFQTNMTLNCWSAYGPLHYGMCLDWLGKFDQSAAYFDRADQLDPNGYFTLDYIGLHYFELGDYAAAKPWFERSSRLEWQDNPLARSYLELIRSRMMEAATNEISARLNEPLR
jgi:tetratricopeptide (TPR) repeat protein